ncbi:MAG: hypothetical protein O3A80_03135 [bacterium]|nr:hypothetical protein [bacterium]
MNAQEVVMTGEKLEQQLGCRLFPNVAIESLREVSIEKLQLCFRRELETIMFVEQLVENGIELEDIRSFLDVHELHSKDRAGFHKEILGFPLKAIGSNIRRQDVDWNKFQVEETGIGYEGDIVIAQALTSTGSTNHIENCYGRDVRLFKGDYFMTVLGNRHSGTSEYGEMPPNGQLEISPQTQVDLLCHGGILGHGICIPSSKSCKTFFSARIAGILQDGDKNLNLLDLYPDLEAEMITSAPIIFNCGTSAEIGKTTASSSVIRALKRRGMRVGATKVAGTGRFRDLLALRDAGADVYYDFPDVGLASTYTDTRCSYQAAVTLFNKINREHVDVIVAEMGGDIIEANIPSILTSQDIMQYARGIIHSSADILGILGSLQQYKEFGVEASIQLTLPKDRNNAGTLDRLKQQKLTAFNTLIETECDQIIEKFFPEKS